MRILLLILIMILTSCSFIRDQEGESAPAEYPDIILENARYTLGQSGENPIYIESTRMTFYSSDNRAVTEALSFVQYDENGDTLLEGSADSADIDTDARVMNLRGNVSLRRKDGNMMIYASSLMFDSGNDEIEAYGDVQVSSDDGSFAGTGFRADLREDMYSFDSITEGVFII